MKAKRVLSDDLVSRLEDKIPVMAEGAINTAYINALAAGRLAVDGRRGVGQVRTYDFHVRGFNWLWLRSLSAIATANFDLRLKINSAAATRSGPPLGH